MAKYSQTEIGALWRACIETYNMCPAEPRPWLKDICSLYDKLSGVKYSKSKNTYEFITKKGN